ncbi:MAG: hypothetical protein ACRDXE_09330 [Acidimicrobiales bacterium]
MGVGEIVGFAIFWCVLAAIMCWGVFSRRPGDGPEWTLRDRMLLDSAWLRKVWGKGRVRRDGSWPRSRPGRH